jgi:hypothetical protein
MESRFGEIKQLLCQKSATKQVVYEATLDVFKQFKSILRNMEGQFSSCLTHEAPGVEVQFSDKGDFEAHLKFGGDTIVMMMHTNVFDFDESHILTKTRYVQEDGLREFCGMIQFYNFLSDSIKYNRENDQGFLVARMFVNRENHFFIDGRRPLSFVYKNFEKNLITPEVLLNIVEEIMMFCLSFDLAAPPVDVTSYISVEQKNQMSYSSGMPTSKHLGFYARYEEED